MNGFCRRTHSSFPQMILMMTKLKISTVTRGITYLVADTITRIVIESMSPIITFGQVSIAIDFIQ